MDAAFAQNLIQRIERAFPNVPFPGDRLVLQEWDSGHLIDLVKGRKWTDLTPMNVRHLADGTHEFTAEAFYYFLPAYLRASLVDASATDFSISAIAWAFLPLHAGETAHRTPEPLTPDQRGVLYDWLKWYINRDRESIRGSIEIVKEKGFQEKEALREMVREEVEDVMRLERDLAQLRLRFPST
jgi:hypothetical protein